MLAEELGHAQVGQRLGVAREDDVPEAIRRGGQARMKADGRGESRLAASTNAMR